MKDVCMLGERRQTSFAFTRFFERKYPVYVDSRLYTPGYKSVLHNHDFPQIWYCLNGSYFHQVGDQVYECAKGSVVMIQSGVFHKFWTPEGKYTAILSVDVMYNVFLDTPYHQYLNAVAALFLPAFTKELGYTIPTYLTLSRESQKVFEECISWMSLLNFNNSASVDKSDILEKLETMFSLPELVLPEYYQAKAMQLVPTRLYPMLQTLSYVNDHYGEKLVEETLLRTMGICRTNFYQFFKRYTGCTYSQYLQMLRAKHVHIYLSRTTYPISYISDMCGFCNTEHMSRTYKKYSGRTPREYRLYSYENYQKRENPFRG